jgi:hypothetical protein
MTGRGKETRRDHFTWAVTDASCARSSLLHIFHLHCLLSSLCSLSESHLHRVLLIDLFASVCVMPQRKTKKARVQHIIVEPDEPSKEPYEATPPPEEDFGEDGLEGEVEAIKSAEYTTLGETLCVVVLVVASTKH